MSFINKINTYCDDRGIEIHEEELISGEHPKGRPQYTAIVTVAVETPDGPFPQQISAKFHAKDIVDAYSKADKELQKEIKTFQAKLEKDMKDAKDEAMAPKIITPD